MPEKKENLKQELQNNDKTVKGAKDQSGNPRREKFLDFYGDGKSVKSSDSTTKTTS